MYIHMMSMSNVVFFFFWLCGVLREIPQGSYPYKALTFLTTLLAKNKANLYLDNKIIP